MGIENKFEIELPDKHASRIQVIKEYLDKKIILENEKDEKFEGILIQGKAHGYYHLILNDEEEYIFSIDEKLKLYSPNF